MIRYASILDCGLFLVSNLKESEWLRMSLPGSNPS